MRKHWHIALPAMILLACCASSVWAAEQGAALQPPPGGPVPAAGAAGQPPEARGVPAKAPQSIPPNTARAGVDPDRLDRVLLIAASQDWAAKDAETQVLAERLLADRATMLQAELERVAAFQKVFGAVRAGDAEAQTASAEGLRSASEKLRQASVAVSKNLDALLARLKKVRPEEAPGAKTPVPAKDAPQEAPAAK